LTEGGIEIIPANFALIRTLADRGIVSSICSRNDYGAVERILSEAGIWDYFVLPSVNWEAKGPRLRALIESLQLRPGSAMFIDDNHLNLKAALHEMPDLQVSDPSIIPRIATLPLFDGKADPDLTRLRQYKLLEQRKADEQAADGDTSAFLRSCNIVVEIEHDITPHLDRAIAAFTFSGCRRGCSNSPFPAASWGWASSAGCISGWAARNSTFRVKCFRMSFAT
jgi:predicted enzyme involved in methoxymalonyl-ACP biosynthesis